MEDTKEADEIEVTPEMIEAGALALSAYDYLEETGEEAAERIFRSMVSASRSFGKRLRTFS